MIQQQSAKAKLRIRTPIAVRDNSMPLKHPGAFLIAQKITKELSQRGVPTRKLPAESKLLRSVAYQYKGRDLIALDARQVVDFDHDNRWTGSQPIEGTRSLKSGRGGLYLAESFPTLTAEGIFYGFRNFDEVVRNAAALRSGKGSASLNAAVDLVDERNVVSSAFFERNVFCFRLQHEKTLVELDSNSEFVKELVRRLDANADIEKVLRAEGAKSSLELLFGGEDYSLSRGAADPLLSLKDIDGLAPSPARTYAEGDGSNVVLSPEGSTKAVASCLPHQEIKFLANHATGADTIVTIALDAHGKPASGTQNAQAAASKSSTGGS